MELSSDSLSPVVTVRDAQYAVSFADAKPTDPPVLIKNRPREIIFNRAHPANCGTRGARKWHLSLGLELAYLLADDRDAEDLYDRMLAFVAAI